MSAMGTHEQIGQALQNLKAGAEWNLSGTEYSGLNWIDAVQTKPTEQEIIDEVALL